MVFDRAGKSPSALVANTIGRQSLKRFPARLGRSRETDSPRDKVLRVAANKGRTEADAF
jgi:hypothetical protein